MPKISNFIYCAKAIEQNEQNGIITALGIMNTIFPDYIPGNYSFSILCGITGLTEGFHTIQIDFVDPKDHVLVHLEGVVSATHDSKIDIPEEYSLLTIKAELCNVVFQECGIYKSVVRVDGKDLGSFEIYAHEKILPSEKSR